MGKLLKILFPAALALAGSMGLADTTGRATIKNESKVPWVVWHNALWLDANFNAYHLNEAQELVRTPFPACLAITVLPGQSIEIESVQKFPDRSMLVSFRRDNPIYFARATFTLDLSAGEDPSWDLKGGYPEHFVQPDGTGILRLVDPRFTGPRHRTPGVQAILDQLEPQGKAAEERKEERKG